MTGVIATIPKFQFSNATGTPLANGTLTVYLAGTTTLTNTWQDYALTSLNTNPVVLDSRGECVLWLDTAVSYKFVLKNSSGVVQWTLDNLTGAGAAAAVLEAALAASNGSSKVGGGDQIVSSIAALRALLKTSSSSNAYVTGYYVAGDGGGGAYYYDATDTVTADNSGTVIVASDGGRWKLAFSGPVSVKTFGAKGDGNTDDAAAIQKCIDFCAGDNGRQVYFAQSNYYIGTALKLYKFSNILGAGPTKSRINLQGKAYTGAVFVNNDLDTFSNVTIKELGIRGGSYGIYNTAATQEQLILENVYFELQTQAGIRSDHDWQINSLNNVSFYYCFQGIYIAAGFANHNSYYSVQFSGITGASYRCESYNEVNNFIGCRFEAGGLAGNIAIQVSNNRDTNFRGCYFENIHNVLLQESSAAGTLFDGCHFTGALTGTTAFIFTSDAEVLFGANTWSIASAGSTKMRITGDNGGKLGKNNKLTFANTKQMSKFVGASSVVASPGATVPLISLTRVTVDGSISDLQASFCMLTLLYRRTTTGGTDNVYSAQIPISVKAIAGAAMSVAIGAAIIAENTISETLTISGSSLTNSSGTIQVAISGVSAGATAFVAWSFEFTSGANTNYNTIIASLP
jgi:hypothetical protein